MTKLDVVGTAGGKATVETQEPNSWRKIRLKSAPKEYKRGPGPTGKDRLQRRVNSLLQAASRLERKAEPGSEDTLWARRLVEVSMAFNAQGYANAHPPFDVKALLPPWECPYCDRIYDKTLTDWEREAANHFDACRSLRAGVFPNE